MVQISVQPVLHLIAQIYLAAQAIIFGAILTMMLPGQLASRDTQKIALANVSARRRKTNLTGYSKHRNF